jgi:choline transport protein
MLITLLFTVGSLDDAINASAPFQNAFTNTGSEGVNIFLTLVLFLLILSGNITAVTTTSRETWAFARDAGLPFSRFMAKVSTRFNAPLNAVWVTTVLSLILCLINLGST